MTIFIVLILTVLVLAFLIDRKRKRTHNDPPHTTHPHAKPGEDKNYLMGDNHHNNSGN